MSSRRRSIAVGDHFVKTSDPMQHIWRVESLQEYGDLPPHTKIRELKTGQLITMSVSALLDTRLFRRAADPEPRPEYPEEY
ncbi:hypothetical protein [Caenispirillum salinarum]|uniref:hypothetical protein n=1 Tax=Caenispirillum salinarum TaxID=859058 RepID=UPI00384E5801